MPSPSIVLLRTQSDERLVALARAGHDRAFEAIVERYRRQLLRACRRILPETRAEDALQQTLMAAWAGLRRGDDVRELRSWLFRIARNTALNQLRMAGYDLDELVETLSAADHPEDEIVRRALVRQTLAAVAALPDRQREALLRTAIEGEGQAEVARDLGLSSTAMRQLVHRARRAVRTAATALVPMPMATWIASAGGATATATLAKAGTLAVLAGGAVAAPTLIDDRPPQKRQPPAAEADAAKTQPNAVLRPKRVVAQAQAPQPTAVATATPARRVTSVATPRPVVQRQESNVTGPHRNHQRPERDEGDEGDRGDGDHEGRIEPVTTAEPIEADESDGHNEEPLADEEREASHGGGGEPEEEPKDSSGPGSGEDIEPDD